MHKSGEWEDMEGLALETTGKWKCHVKLLSRCQSLFEEYSYCYLSFHSKRNRHEPVLLDGSEGGGPAREWSQIALGNSHSVGVTPKGEVSTWGHGGNVSLGHGTKDNILKPAHVKSLVGKTVTHVCCSDHTVVVTTEGELFTW